jgi:ATP-dependent RNA helicase DeaD
VKPALPPAKPRESAKPVAVKTKPPADRPKREAPKRDAPNGSQKKTPPWARREPLEAKPEHPKRRPVVTSDFTRLHMNLGQEMGIEASDIVGAIAGETGLPPKVVGPIDIRDRHLFVDVAIAHTNAILSRLNRTQIKGYKVKLKTA